MYHQFPPWKSYSSTSTYHQDCSIWYVRIYTVTNMWLYINTNQGRYCIVASAGNFKIENAASWSGAVVLNSHIPPPIMLDTTLLCPAQTDTASAILGARHPTFLIFPECFQSSVLTLFRLATITR